MTVNLEPDTAVGASDIGMGQTVYLTVQDERTEGDIGHRGAAMMKGAKITMEQDLSGVQVSAALKAIAQGESETYENFYRYENEDRVVVVPGADSNNERINVALNEVLHQLMRDRKLLEILAQ